MLASLVAKVLGMVKEKKLCSIAFSISGGRNKKRNINFRLKIMLATLKQEMRKKARMRLDVIRLLTRNDVLADIAKTLVENV